MFRNITSTRRCLDGLELRRFTVGETTFGRSATISWAINEPRGQNCSNVKYRIDSEPNLYDDLDSGVDYQVGQERHRFDQLEPVGDVSVNPARTRTYTLEAIPRGLSGRIPGLKEKTLASGTVVAGNIVRYTQMGDEWVRNPNPHSDAFDDNSNDAAEKAAEGSLEIIGSLSESHRRRLHNKVIKLHLIPVEASITDLPPYENLAGDTKGGSDWADAAGAGGVLKEEGRIVMACAEVEMLDLPGRRYPLGYILAHEMGHTVLGSPRSGGQFQLHAVSEAELRKLKELFEARVEEGGEFLPGVEILGDNKDFEEYFAEGTAAMFEKPWDGNNPDSVSMYTPDWLRENDPDLYDLLARIYSMPRHPPSIDRSRSTVRDHRADTGNRDRRDSGPIVRDHRTQPTVRDHRRRPVVRDHREESGSRVRDQDPIVRDHRKNTGTREDNDQDPIVRDHRERSREDVDDQDERDQGPRVRDHRDYRGH